MRHVFLIAGEPSGDKLGAGLMAGLKELEPDIRFSGIGGPQMQAEGLNSLFPMSELSVMGIAEILPKLFGLLARVREAARAVCADLPDALVTIDSPDFCLRVASKVKARNPKLKTVHYVAPTVWAWRPERAEKMARHIDHVLALFPFEPPLMQAAGMTCDFVGHPVAAEPQPSADEVLAIRAELGVAADAKLLAVLPGSRSGEVKRMGPIFAEVIGHLHAANPELRFVVPLASNVAARLTDLAADWPGHPILLDPRNYETAEQEHRKRLAFAASDLALATSGTVSLELAAVGTPMVIAYRFNWLTTRIIKRKVKLETATLVNILTDTRAVPEFLLDDCRVEGITDKVSSLLENETERTAQISQGEYAMSLLGQGEPGLGLRAAKSVLSLLP